MNDFMTTPDLLSLFSNFFSGATLFTILLDSHTQIVSNGESLPFNSADRTRYDCSCGQYLSNCPFYRTVAEHMRSPETGQWDTELFVQWPNFSRSSLVRTLLNSPHCNEWLRNYVINGVPTYRHVKERFISAQLRFFINALAFDGASIYMDGTKSMRRARLFADDGRCNMKAIHFIRDGRAFCYSYYRHKKLKPSEGARAAREWVYYIRQVDQFAAAFPNIPILEVRYEDLCRSTSSVIETVTGFLGIPYEDCAVTGTKGMHILGNRMRRTFSGEIVEDTSWRHRLSSEIQAEVTDIMSAELERFGYL